MHASFYFQMDTNKLVLFILKCGLCLNHGWLNPQEIVALALLVFGLETMVLVLNLQTFANKWMPQLLLQIQMLTGDLLN